LPLKNKTRLFLIAAVVVLYVLHQDFWFWRVARPFVFGFIPIGLFYQAVFSVAAALLMWLLVKYAWPAHLEDEVEQRHETETGDDAL
jgi:hypothetical protein